MYRGHSIKPSKLEIDRANMASLRHAKAPANKTELWPFFGLCVVYRKLIEHFTKNAALLKRLLEKGSPDSFTLDKDQEKGFQELIESIINPPAFGLFAPSLPFLGHYDKNTYGIGCPLLQIHEEGERKSIGFWLRLLNSAEQNYSKLEQ